MSGWFKIYRKIFDNSIWKNPAEFRLFIWILSQAAYTEEGTDYGKITVGKGQFLRSYRKLSEDLEYVENRQVKRYSNWKIKRIVDSLKDKGIIEILETELGTLFTIRNYEKYQGINSYQYMERQTVTKQYPNNTNNNKNNKKIMRLENLPKGAC